MTRNLLLISNSTLHGSGYLDHCESEIRDILGKRKSVLFIPYAQPGGMTWKAYTSLARQRLEKMGYTLHGIHTANDLWSAIDHAEALFIGGGNTFMLLYSLFRDNLISTIKGAVADGLPYIGTSAGANVAGRTIKTTNDMPVVLPPSLDALGLIPFIINPHYLDTDPQSKHMGETRETRIKEYQSFNNDTVVGLREGAMLRVIDDHVSLRGSSGARIFRKGQDPTEHQPGESLDFLL